MKVLNLQCAHQHTFEGWFGSEEEFQTQLTDGLLECPMCGDQAIVKGLSAPRLNLSGKRAEVAHDQAPQKRQDVVAPMPADQSMQAAWMKMMRHVMDHSEDVGDKFAEEARKIHYGESRERSIRGQASQQETAELLEEGIAVLPLAMHKTFKGPLQ